MGRAGITLLDVEKAAIQLQGRGKNPTVDAIRELLGTGSKSTIIQHLKVWRAKNGEGQGNLPQELLALVTGLWERLNLQAENRIIEIENTNNQQLELFTQQLNQSQKELADLKTSFHQLEENFALENANKIKCETELQNEQQAHFKLQDRHQTLTAQLEEQKSENMRLHQLAINIQANLEHYQAAMQQARLEQNLAIEKQQLEFQQTTKALQKEVSALQKHSLEVERQLGQRDLEWNQLKEQYDLLKQDYQTQKLELQTHAHELIIFKERTEQLQQQVQSQQNEISNKNNKLLELEKHNAILADQREQLKTNLSHAEDKIELLRQEKLFWNQEKVELQSHVKRLEVLQLQEA